MWRKEARLKVAELLRCDTSVSFLPLHPEEAFQSDTPIALTEYAEHYHTLDPMSNTYRSVGTEAFVWPTLRPRCERLTRGPWTQSEFCNDWVRKQRLCQPAGLTVVRVPHELPAVPFDKWRGIAGLWFYWNADAPGVSGERELAMLGLLLPAFEAGLHVLLRCGRERELVASALGTLGDGAVLVDEAGRIRYENSAFGQLLGRATDGVRVRAVCARMGRSMLGLARRKQVKSRPGPEHITEPLHEQVRTAVGSYRLRGAVTNPPLVGSAPMALVVLERVPATAPAPAHQVRQRYHLTARELTVSSLLSQGRSNAEVAHLLGVSIHTARRHVEHVLVKLGVHSRAAVGAKLRED